MVSECLHVLVLDRATEEGVAKSATVCDPATSPVLLLSIIKGRVSEVISLVGALVQTV